MVLEGGPSNDYYLVANNEFFNCPETQALLDEAPAFADYLDPSDRNGKVYLWFGPTGTVTPLHHDIMNILVAEVYGRKRFTFVPPEETTYIYNGLGVYSDVDCKNPDYARHPLYQYANPISLVLGPGDVLFIPVGWWHHVEALDTSIMLSYTNFRFPNDYEWFHPNLW
jgi:ribosomal protein L16 Arg81 hydroxylase